jgi:hypothetical protein
MSAWPLRGLLSVGYVLRLERPGAAEYKGTVRRTCVAVMALPTLY